MDPSKPDSFNHRTEKLSTSRTYHFIDQKPDGYDPKKTITLLVVHGFPEFWWSWRYQIKPWVTAGYRVIVPDMLGYSGRGTDEPEDFAEYTTKKLSDDLAALLDLIEVEKAVVIGHDWGSFIVGRFVLWHPKRLLALILLSIAYVAPSNHGKMTLEEYVSMLERGNPELGFAPYLDFGYQLYFASQNADDDMKNPDVRRRFLRIVLRYYDKNAPGITKRGQAEELLVGSKADFDLSTIRTVFEGEELEYFISQFPSLHGPLAYYRTSELRYDEENDPETGLFTGKEGGLKPSISSDLPVLFIRGLEDPTSAEGAKQEMLRIVPQTKLVELHSGHWIMTEAKDEVSAEVLKWLQEELKLLSL